MSPVRSIARFGAAPVLAAALLLAACAGALEPPSAHASGSWPPVWQDSPPPNWVDDGVPRFQPPSAAHCRRLPGVREVPGAAAMQNVGPSWAARVGRGEAAAAEGSDVTSESRLERRADAADRMAGESATKSADAARSRGGIADGPGATWRRPPRAWRASRHHPAGRSRCRSHRPCLGRAPRTRPSPPAWWTTTPTSASTSPTVPATPALPVRDRDIGERYLLEVTDAAGRPVHDAEVAVQRAGRAEPVAWAPHRHRRPRVAAPSRLPRCGRGAGSAPWASPCARAPGRARTTLARGDKAALQVRLGSAMPTQRPRLDLVFPDRCHGFDGRRDRQAQKLDACGGAADRAAAGPARRVLRPRRLPRSRRCLHHPHPRFHRRPRRLPAGAGAGAGRRRRRHARGPERGLARGWCTA